MFKFSIFKSIIFFVGLAILLAGFLVFAQADPFDDLSYPISELNNCQDKDDCQEYCDRAENMGACLNYAESNGLLPQEEIEMARRMLAAGQTAGPGGCQGIEECDAYCDNIDHIQECVAFAEQHNLLPEDELEEARKIIAAIEQGITPPPCGSESECDVYCSAPENMATCIEFAIAAGLMPPDEIEEAQMMLRAIQQGIAPPDCGGKEACDAYCAAPENMEECMEFALAAGFVSADEAEEMKMMLEIIKQGINPPNCRGEEECDVYCSQEEHIEECINFAVAAGFMTEADAEMARKTGGKGPGGCKGEECETFCDNPDNMLTCMEFALEYGLAPEEDLEQMRKMVELGITGGPGNCQSEEECQAFCENPDNMDECIDFSIKMGHMTQEEAEQMRQGGGMMQQGGSGGPGGCQTEEECDVYCQDPANVRECIQAGVDSGHISQEEAEEMLRGFEMMEMMGEQPQGMPGAPETLEEEMWKMGEMMPYPESGTMPQEQMGPSLEGEMLPPRQKMMQPSPEEMEDMIRREAEEIRQKEEERIKQEIMEQMIQEMAPQPAPEQEQEQEKPQSLLAPVQLFLGNLLSAFGF